MSKKKKRRAGGSSPRGPENKVQHPRRVRFFGPIRSIAAWVLATFTTFVVLWTTFQVEAWPKTGVEVTPSRSGGVPLIKVSATTDAPIHDVEVACVVKLWNKPWNTTKILEMKAPNGTDSVLDKGSGSNSLGFDARQCAPDGGETRDVPEASKEAEYIFVHYYDSRHTPWGADFLWSYQTKNLVFIKNHRVTGPILMPESPSQELHDFWYPPMMKAFAQTRPSWETPSLIERYLQIFKSN